jgi:hypothetical protein
MKTNLLAVLPRPLFAFRRYQQCDAQPRRAIRRGRPAQASQQLPRTVGSQQDLPAEANNTADQAARSRPDCNPVLQLLKCSVADQPAHGDRTDVALHLCDGTGRIECPTFLLHVYVPLVVDTWCKNGGSRPEPPK